MKWPELAALIKARLQPVLAKLEAIPARDRVALVLCALAMVIGAELMVLGPMASKRAAIASAGDQESKAAAQTAALEAQSQLDQLQALKARAAQVEAENKDQGIAKAQGEPVAALLARALHSRGVNTVSLRSLGSEALANDAPGSGADPAAAEAAPHAATAAAAGAAHPGAVPAPAPARTLYKHRYELILAGDAPALSASAGALETGLAPLRIERVRMLPGKSDALQLVVTFGLIGTERSWLNL